MKRHITIGFGVALVVTLATAVIASGTLADTMQPLTVLLTLPALPLVAIAATFFPPPMGEAEPMPWDNRMFVFAVLVAALIWGLLAARASWYFSKDRK